MKYLTIECSHAGSVFICPVINSFHCVVKLSQARGDLLSQPDVAHICQQCLRELLCVHPPGQHSLVDNQYTKFLQALGAKVVGTFTLWEHMEKQIW